jgi:CheY-like chemotaxis protein
MPVQLLYVDDEADIREVAVMAIELDPDLKVRPCASGAEAIEQARALKPALILLDVMMPVMDGPATFAKLVEDPETAGIPIVFITARTQAQDIERLEGLGAKGVIAKPFDPLALAGIVKSYL